MKNLKEDAGAAPLNSAGSGAIASIGVGKQGEPGISANNHSAIMIDPLRRKKPQTFKEETDTVYICRKLLNANDLIEFAKKYGVTDITEDMHVTIAHSVQEVDWNKISLDTNELRNNNKSGRQFSLFGNALVLEINSPYLQKRWNQLRDIGCSWDFPSYRPHVTLSYNFDKVLRELPPYHGELRFGPEILTPISNENELIKMVIECLNKPPF